ncbi:MAG: hypothetical protein ACJ8DJ_06100 [Gemmatimonadales bacterium]
MTQPTQDPPSALGHLVVATLDVGGLEHLAVDFELELAHGAVAHRTGRDPQ